MRRKEVIGSGRPKFEGFQFEYDDELDRRIEEHVNRQLRRIGMRVLMALAGTAAASVSWKIIEGQLLPAVLGAIGA